MLLAGLFSASGANAGQLLVENVHGATLSAAGPVLRFEAMLVQDGKVVATGRREEIAARADTDAQVLDGQGRFLLPGLIDAHGHLNNLGKLRLQANLVGTRSQAEALERIRAHAASHGDDPWLLGRGWNETLWTEAKLPTAQALDAVVADRPAWFRRVDGHAGWANTAALRAAGISRDTPDPAGGRIERDAQGEATGVLVDAALDLLERAIPARTPAQNAAALDAALAELASLGLTGVSDAGIDSARHALYRRYASEGRLSLRVHGMIDEIGADFDAISAELAPGALINETYAARAVKLYADGSLGSRGAALLAPYADQPGHAGALFEATDTLAAKIGKALALGYQVGVHAIGDAGNRQALDAYALAYAAHPGAAAQRNRIEHAQVVALEDIPRFKELQLVAAMQPTHATSDMNMAEDRIGAERIRGAYAWRRFLAQGTKIAAGSDFPVESANPFFGIHAAVTRQDHEGKPPGGWYPDQAMSVAEALRAFTLDAAYAQHADARVGSLEPGKWADFILVDQDIFAVAPAQLWQTKVLETWLAGKRVYAAQP